MKKGIFPAVSSAALAGLCELMRLTKGDAGGPSADTKDYWQRQNYRGATVNLTGGVSLAASLLAGALPWWREESAVARAVLVACGGAAVAGWIDDQGLVLGSVPADEFEYRSSKPADTASDLDAEPEASTEPKGLTGHLQALSRGQVTTGVTKIVIIGVASGLAAAMLTGKTSCVKPGSSFSSASGCSGVPRGQKNALGEWALNSIIIAASANLHNLFDVRPGRARKFGATLLALGFALAPRQDKLAFPAPLLAQALAQGMNDDLGEVTMLGDVGANSLGAGVGVALCRLSTAKRIGFASGLTGLILLSEKVSFSRIIEAVPLLQYLDELGRNP